MQADDAESPRGATALATAAAALVGPYPIDEDALRKLKRLHDAGVVDDHTFRRRKAEALGLAEPTAFADARSMDVDAIVDDAPGEDDAAIGAGEEPPPAYKYYARRGTVRDGVKKGASGPANFRDADGALLLEAPFGEAGGARVVMKGFLYRKKFYAPNLRAKPNSDSWMLFETDFGYKLPADLPPVRLSLYSAHHLDANGEEILMGLYSYHTRERTELLYWFKANDTWRAASCYQNANIPHRAIHTQARLAREHLPPRDPLGSL